MGIIRTQEDSHVKELAKWEHRGVQINGTWLEPVPFERGGKGGAPWQEYPKMLYRAESQPGGPRISEMITVDNETQEANQISRGYCVRQEDAIARVGQDHLEFARLAAERAYLLKRMSPKAQAEAAAIDETVAEHLPDIPETPIKRRGGRPKKVAADAAKG